MKTVHITRYECEICGATYLTPREAGACESRPISHDKGVKVGDYVLVTAGDGSGQRALVEARHIVKDWGQHAWEHYWHTVALTARMVDSWGHRFLTFDDYERLSDA